MTLYIQIYIYIYIYIYKREHIQNHAHKLRRTYTQTKPSLPTPPTQKIDQITVFFLNFHCLMNS